MFANPARGNEKGSVENQVGDERRKLMVTLQEAHSIEELNEQMRHRCLEYLGHRMSGRAEPVGRLLEVERRHLRPLPDRPLFVGAVREVVANSSSRVRFQTNQYSVPVSCAYERLTLKANPFRVRVYRGEELVADHERSYERHQLIDEWRHMMDRDLLSAAGTKARRRAVRRSPQRLHPRILGVLQEGAGDKEPRWQPGVREDA